MHHQDSTAPANSQAIFRASIYLRALTCARFSPIEIAIVFLVFDHCWFRPRLIRGLTKVFAVELSASRLAPMIGFARQNIQETIKNLSMGGVLIQNDRGFWKLNPRWQEWMDENGRLRIKATCYSYIQQGFPEPHDCDAPPPGPGGIPLSPDGDTPCRQMATPPVVERRHPAPETAPAAASNGSQIHCSNGFAQVSPIGDASSSPLSPDGDTEPPPLSPNGDTLARAPIGNAPAPRAITERAPASDYDSSKREVKGSHDIYIKREHLTTVDIKPDDANFDIFRRDDASFPGDVVPDPETFRRVHALVLARYPMNDSIQQGIYKCRFQYETAWVLKAVKRAALLKPRCANFGYVNAILVGWLRGGGTDEGPEDRYDDNLDLIPVVPFSGKGAAPAGGKVDMEEANRMFQEMHERLYGKFGS